MITDRPNLSRMRLATTAWLFLLYAAMTNETTTAETFYEGLPTGPGLIREGRDGTVYAAVLGAADGLVMTGAAALGGVDIDACSEEVLLHMVRHQFLCAH